MCHFVAFLPLLALHRPFFNVLGSALNLYIKTSAFFNRVCNIISSVRGASLWFLIPHACGVRNGLVDGGLVGGGVQIVSRRLTICTPPPTRTRSTRALGYWILTR